MISEQLRANILEVADYAEWVERHPAPDMQDLVAQYGGYNNITAQAWAEHDARVAEWQEARRRR